MLLDVCWVVPIRLQILSVLWPSQSRCWWNVWLVRYPLQHFCTKYKRVLYLNVSLDILNGFMLISFSAFATSINPLGYDTILIIKTVHITIKVLNHHHVTVTWLILKHLHFTNLKSFTHSYQTRKEQHAFIVLWNLIYYKWFSTFLEMCLLDLNALKIFKKF